MEWGLPLGPRGVWRLQRQLLAICLGLPRYFCVLSIWNKLRWRPLSHRQSDGQWDKHIDWSRHAVVDSCRHGRCNIHGVSIGRSVSVLRSLCQYGGTVLTGRWIHLQPRHESPEHSWRINNHGGVERRDVSNNWDESINDWGDPPGQCNKYLMEECGQ